MLAAVKVVKKFHTYWHGTDFTLVTDYQALSLLLMLVSMLARWDIILQQTYNFIAVHYPKLYHQNADYISRIP
eukprot:scaffold293625_cov23-Tisochrysis_lutea.AAC.1